MRISRSQFEKGFQGLPIFCLFALSVSSLRAENWPHWRGPDGNGVSKDANPPTRWSDTENITWKAEVTGKGSSTPVVWDDRIFLTAQTEDKKEWVIGLDRANGKTLWEYYAGEGMTRTRAGANMASASAATDGERVVATFGTGQLVCLDFAGKELWKHDLQKENGKFTIWWGYSNSPVIAGDTVFVTVINEGPSYLLALDKVSGKVKWHTPRKTEAKSEPCDSYATPIVYTANNRKEVFTTGALWGTAYDYADGKLLWKANLGGDRTILSPVFDDGMIYVTAGKRGPIYSLQPGGEGDVTPSGIKWSHEKSTPDVPSLLALGYHLYFINDGGVAMCLSKKSGEVLWQERIEGDIKASPVAAGGMIYFTNTGGHTTVIKQGAAFEKVAANSLGEDAAMASLAFSDGQIFQRGQHHLYCIGARSK